MALNQLGLGFVFTAKDLASGVIGRVENAFGGMEEKAEAATKNFIESQEKLRNVGLAIAGAGIAIIGAAAALAVQAGVFLENPLTSDGYDYVIAAAWRTT